MAEPNKMTTLDENWKRVLTVVAHPQIKTCQQHHSLNHRYPIRYQRFKMRLAGPQKAQS